MCEIQLPLWFTWNYFLIFAFVLTLYCHILPTFLWWKSVIEPPLWFWPCGFLLYRITCCCWKKVSVLFTIKLVKWGKKTYPKKSPEDAQQQAVWGGRKRLPHCYGLLSYSHSIGLDQFHLFPRDEPHVAIFSTGVLTETTLEVGKEFPSVLSWQSNIHLNPDVLTFNSSARPPFITSGPFSYWQVTKYMQGRPLPRL